MSAASDRGESDARAENGDAPGLRDVAVVFATLGFIGFGGPAAHIAMTRREVVERRGWMTNGQFVDLMGLTSMIPGPTSTELAMLVGQRVMGWRGLLVAGMGFILPAAAIALTLAWAYVEFGALPAVGQLLYGIKPVVVAIIVAAIVSLGRTALTGPLRVALAVLVATLWLLGVNELLLLATAAMVMAVARLGGVTWLARAAVTLPAGGLGVAATFPVDLGVLGAVFLKAGALLFGSGYVLIAFLRGDLVDRLGWLTDAQLLEAVAIGQVIPGPLFTTATFIGYVLAGLPGAAIATVAIFLPAFVFAGLVAAVARRVRDRPLTAAVLDGLNAAAIGLMAGVTFEIGRSAIIDPLTVALAALALIGLVVARIPSVLLIAAGAAAGLGAGVVGIGP